MAVSIANGNKNVAENDVDRTQDQDRPSYYLQRKIAVATDRPFSFQSNQHILYEASRRIIGLIPLVGKEQAAFL